MKKLFLLFVLISSFSAFSQERPLESVVSKIERYTSLAQSNEINNDEAKILVHAQVDLVLLKGMVERESESMSPSEQKLNKWNEMLKRDEISLGEFKYLVKSQIDLQELKELTK